MATLIVKSKRSANADWTTLMKMMERAQEMHTMNERLMTKKRRLHLHMRAAEKQVDHMRGYVTQSPSSSKKRPLGNVVSEAVPEAGGETQGKKKEETEEDFGDNLDQVIASMDDKSSDS